MASTSDEPREVYAVLFDGDVPQFGVTRVETTEDNREHCSTFSIYYADGKWQETPGGPENSDETTWKRKIKVYEGLKEDEFNNLGAYIKRSDRVPRRKIEESWPVFNVWVGWLGKFYESQTGEILNFPSQINSDELRALQEEGREVQAAAKGSGSGVSKGSRRGKTKSRK